MPLTPQNASTLVGFAESSPTLLNLSSQHTDSTLASRMVIPSPLKQDNPIMKWLSVEEELGDPFLLSQKERALHNLNSLIAKALTVSDDKNKPVGEKILAIYKSILDSGFVIEEFHPSFLYRDSLTYNLAKKQLDCDTSSAIVVAIATALNWPDVKLVILPDHVFIRWNNQNYDRGVVLPNSAYPSLFARNQEQYTLDGARGIEAMSWFARGLVSGRKELYPQAIASYSTALGIHPQHQTAYNNRGNIYALEGDDYRAIADYSRAVELTPEFAEAYNNRGVAYERLGDVEKAIADYSKAIELDPDYTTSLFNRGMTYANIGSHHQAIKDYSKVISLNPIDAGAYYRRSFSYQALKEFHQAKADYQKALQLNPSLAEQSPKPYIPLNE